MLEKFAGRIDGDPASVFDRIAINPTADCWKRQRGDVFFDGQVQAALIASGQQGFILRFAAVNRADRMNDVSRWEIVPTGEAKITGGYNLPARYVIHTVGPIYSGKPQDKTLLTACYQNSLNLATEKGITSLAFPAISCGVYGYPIEDACRVAVDTTGKFLQHNQTIEKVIFMLFSPEDLKVYQEYIRSLGT